MASRLFLVPNEMFARTRCVSTVLLTATAKLLNQLDGAGFITGCRSNIKQSMRCTEQSFERMSCNVVQKQEKSKLKELLQLKFLTLIFYERRELETRRLFSIDRKKFLGLVRTEIILTSISPVPAADQNVWNCSRKSIG